MDRDRRKLLAGVGVGAVGGIAGCTGTDSPDDSGNATTTATSNSSKKKTPDSDRVVTGSELEEYETVSFTMQSYTKSLLPQRYEWTHLFHDQLVNKLGVEAEVQIGQVGQIFDNWVNVDYDVNMAGWSGKPSRIDPNTFLSAFHTDGGLYTPNYSNPEYDELVEKSQRETDREARKELVMEAQQILAEDVPVVFLFADDALAATNTANWSNYTSQIGDQNYVHVWNLMSMEPQGDLPAIKAGTLFPATLNPMAPTKSADLMGLKMVYDRLVRLGPDGQPQPWAATEWTAPEPDTFDVTLRDDMTWHDGEDVTPEDVTFTIEFLQEWGVPYMKSFYDPIESVEVVDDNVVRFNLESASASFTGVNLALLFILPKHVWDGLPEDEGLEHPKNYNDTQYVGSGPFTVNTFEESNRVVFDVYDDHWADFNVDSFIWKKYGGKTQALATVEKGDASWVVNIQPGQFERAKQNQGVEANGVSQHGWKAIYMNNARRPFDDKMFRKAVAHATDKERVIKLVYGGRADSIEGPIPPANDFWHNPDLPSYDGGEEKARRMLFEAGYRWNEDGTLLMPKE
ncbi:ABC transporter substrate-binding protein [Halorussus litoreus]|uniref:ABC transporter substrate-binding protein n=1 Tax=Halorussus litoreus TaxID=1710536 RepID=UPI000E22B811|nr:ABC transporter substrate-binding protein [Halorussus litoreus]